MVKSRPNLYSTVGVHPTRCDEFFGGDSGGDPEAHVAALAAVLEEGKTLGKVRTPYCTSEPYAAFVQFV